MTSLRQIEANRRNALKSTGPVTQDGKEHSRRNAVRHGLTAETVIGVLEDAEDYKAFEAAITADYDAPSAVERELVLRLASLLWRLRRATAVETGLFAIQAEGMSAFGPSRERQLPPATRALIYATFGLPEQADLAPTPPAEELPMAETAAGADSVPAPSGGDLSTALAPAFLRLANLPNSVFDRLSRYEIMLWRQVDQVLLTLDALDRRKPQERRRLTLATPTPPARKWRPREF
jgi:hypothetical protein